MLRIIITLREDGEVLNMFDMSGVGILVKKRLKVR